MGLRLSVLGEPVVSVNGAAMRLKPRKVLALLAFLAVTGSRHSRDFLAEMLFPRLGRERARAGIRQGLTVLRSGVGSELICSDGDMVWLNHESDMWIDLREAARPVQAREDAERVDQLFRGEFLRGFRLPDAPAFDDWQRSQEESARALHVTVLKKLVESCREANEHDTAIHYGRRWLSFDPTDEAGHRSLMESYAAAGRRAEAFRQYER